LESVGTRNFILRQNPYTYKYNPTSNRKSEKKHSANYFMEYKRSHSGNCYPDNEIKIYKVGIRIN